VGSATRSASERAERRAQGLIAVSFCVISAYIAVEATRTLLGGDHPDASWIGIALAAVTLLTMLVGLGVNALVGWWWADPVAALLIAVVAVREGREAWRGEACCEPC
jgi:divalent metal cation (Fe/Co/Zn/Cd) transporter